MVITYYITQQDAMKASLYQYEKSLLFKQQKIRLWFWLVAIIVVVDLLLHQHLSLFSLWVTLLLTVVWLPLSPLLLRYAYQYKAKKTFSQEKSPQLLGKKTLTLAEEGIAISSVFGEEFHSYFTLSKIEKDADTLYLFFTEERLPIFIPLQAFQDQQEQISFITFLQTAKEKNA